MSAERFPVTIKNFPSFMTITGRVNVACQKCGNINAHINAICNDIYNFCGMKVWHTHLLVHSNQQSPLIASTAIHLPQRTPPVSPDFDGGCARLMHVACMTHMHLTTQDQVDAVSFSARPRRRIVSTLWQVFLQKQLQVREAFRGRTQCWRRGYAV